jgi:hypothetical protein
MVKNLDTVINRLQYKADNIKAKLDPSYFTECIEYLKTLPREINENDIMINQLARKYAVSLLRYGVDISEKWETASQNSVALQQAYLRGRQDERDRFDENYDDLFTEKKLLEEQNYEVKNSVLNDFVKEIVAEYDNDGCQSVSDYLDYRLSIRELLNIAESLKERFKNE